MQDALRNMISMRGLVPGQIRYLGPAGRALAATKQEGDSVPAAPGVSSRISPGTVPMKKGMR